MMTREKRDVASLTPERQYPEVRRFLSRRLLPTSLIVRASLPGHMADMKD
jgi:hypothetical protein